MNSGAGGEDGQFRPVQVGQPLQGWTCGIDEFSSQCPNWGAHRRPSRRAELMEGSQELSSLEASFLSMPTLCTANHSQVPLPSFFCVAFSFCLLPSLASFALSFLLLAPHEWLNPAGCVCVCVCVCVCAGESRTPNFAPLSSALRVPSPTQAFLYSAL